jgi:hypothetical protein
VDLVALVKGYVVVVGSWIDYIGRGKKKVEVVVESYRGWLQ